ncbi:MAG: MarR family transcriptional regulator [Bacteroidota bacterium]
MMQLPHETIFYLLEKSMKRYRKLAQQKIQDAGFDVSINQLILLMSLRDRPESSQVELAELIFKDFASVARMVDLLVKKGYLKRIESKKDRRKKDLIPSASCQQMLDKLTPVIQEYRGLALNEFSQEEIGQVQSFLKQLIHNCEKHSS